MTPSISAERAFYLVDKCAKDMKYRFIYTPRLNDIILIDNWRVCHGRKDYSMVGQRVHQRAWTKQIARGRCTNLMLGLRPMKLHETNDAFNETSPPDVLISEFFGCNDLVAKQIVHENLGDRLRLGSTVELRDHTVKNHAASLGF